MKAYWDASALVRAFRARKSPRGYTRSHSLAEFYSTLTGRGITVALPAGKTQLVLSPGDAVRVAKATFANLEWVDLTPTQTRHELTRAAAANVQGANIHDWFHVAAAGLSATQVATLNRRHFEPILGSLKLANLEDALAESPGWPAD